ncbi:MAG: ribonucleoside triphosphate reductase [bacterium (Candidatus Stahlbacteria) CG08_land_8_20_14_0_20_40_26]|nr:MAG: ribonucleoside triphosphate reductase [bacterium (Candidatus Stahlbacteria) CG23_combo_of_CG06-09_8_20_14_all_40_9]PIS25114.1 MAG: ribonucleoside triphosphate reductase [bacterium (Candidatus Stahlbacteria) CG08_land_8_20_14_0_20_40_26]
MLDFVKKRDGYMVPFNPFRIQNAILKAASATGEQLDAKALTDRVVEILEKMERVPHIEDIQDIVEKVLIEDGKADTAKAYILYRQRHAELRKTKKLLMDVSDTVNGYLTEDDWRMKENANADYSLSGLMMHTAGSMIARYTLENIYISEIAKAHTEGDFHIHDLSMGIAGYCAGWSLRQLLYEGFNGVPRKVEASPPKHLETALGQMVNFLGTLQNEWAGAMAFNSFDTFLAPLVRKERLSYEDVYQAVQTFVFSVNVASRWGGQTPFVNLTFDFTIPEDLKDQKVTIDEKYSSGFGYYGEFQKEADMINKAFLEIMLKGDNKGRIFTFPIPTYNLTSDFKWDSENAHILFKATSKYGLPYFSNFISSNLNPSDVRSMCCRLRLDLRELRRNVTGGLFGSGDSTGSVGVVTINMPRLGYMSKTEDEFLERLSSLMELARDSLELKRRVVEQNIRRGLLPYTKRYLGTLANHFSTIGLVGMNEACLNLFGEDIGSERGTAFAEKVLDFMLLKLLDFQEETGNIYNLEATPAEGTAYRLARIDKQKFPDIITQGKEAPYYTNSTMLPVAYTDDIFEAFILQEGLQSKYTGGTVIHVYLGEEIDDEDACATLVKRIAENFRVPYFSMTPTFSICEEHGYIRGEHYTCPMCGKQTEVYSRVVGYYRPVQNWNKGKKEEYKQRKVYAVAR